MGKKTEKKTATAQPDLIKIAAELAAVLRKHLSQTPDFGKATAASASALTAVLGHQVNITFMAR